ncbi:MAG: aldo/keto reductase [Woeseiaceae bacterium]|nr:aldo/keto reductase [Woeseiaceae bacterium]
MNSAWNRREALLAGAGLALAPISAIGMERKMIARAVPSSGEMIPVVGLGTYNVFDVESSPDAIATRKKIVDLLTGEGGSMIDTSPMYNRSEKVIGDIIDAGSPRDALFLATKVWTDGADAGARQMQRSLELMNARVIDLMQVHNLRDTDVHMKTIRDWQADGRIRYNGLTHYTASAHAALEAGMRKHRPEFIQINYSLGELEAETRVLPLAQDLGIAVIINRPYFTGRLFAAVAGIPLPAWAQEFAGSWGQFFLKFIISHPAVTCVIPATSKPHHMTDNTEAGFGPLPDEKIRRRMVDFVKAL